MQDWRGTEIEIGSTIVYGSVFQSTSRPVTAEVVALVPPKDGESKWTPTGQDRVKARVIGSSFGYRAGNQVHVIANRVTVVNLP